MTSRDSQDVVEITHPNERNGQLLVQTNQISPLAATPARKGFNLENRLSESSSSSSSSSSPSIQPNHTCSPKSCPPAQLSRSQAISRGTLLINKRPETISDSDRPSDKSLLDDEIRGRLDKLNALSDLINSLEGQFDDANRVFRETLKCSTERLSLLAESLGKKSIRHGRNYNTARLFVEQSQFECQKACVQFQQATKEHQLAREAIKEAEKKLKEIAGQAKFSVIAVPKIDEETLNLSRLDLSEDATLTNGCYLDDNICRETHNTHDHASNSQPLKDQTISEANDNMPDRQVEFGLRPSEVCENDKKFKHNLNIQQVVGTSQLPQDLCASTIQTSVDYATRLSEELNQAILRLREVEKQKRSSERNHLDQANKLMIAQEKLTKLERDYGGSIRRSQGYFDEARKFHAKLNTVKGDIERLREEILVAKQSYADTLNGIERFSEELHLNSKHL